MCQSGVSTNHLRNGGPEMNATTYGLDVAKRVFQMYWVDAQTGEIVNRRFGPRARRSDGSWHPPPSSRCSVDSTFPPLLRSFIRVCQRQLRAFALRRF